jgi:hypothetical protein
MAEGPTPRAAAPTFASPGGPDNDAALALHTLLVALTPFIPLPFVDDIAKNLVMRRLVRTLARAHGLSLSDAEVRTLADDKGGSLLMGLVKGALLAPIKFIIRKLVIILTGKRIVELASDTYHRAFLIDRAFANRWCAPVGAHPPEKLRDAIDSLIAATPIASSPVTRALREGLSRSKDAIVAAVDLVRARATGAGNAEATVEEFARTQEEKGTAANLLDALTTVPREHFADLEQRLRARLGGGADDPRIVVRRATEES